MMISSSRERKWLYFLMAAGLLLGAFVVGGPASATHAPTDKCLDVDNGVQGETDVNPTGTTHSVTATLRNRDAAPGAGDACNGTVYTNTTGSAINIDFEVFGTNDPGSDGDQRTPPDLTCSIEPGASTCTSGTYTGTSVGSETIRGWVDRDHNDETFEGDGAEQRDDTSPTTWGTGDACSPVAAQTGAEPDCTDVVQKSWEPGQAATLDCDDETGPDTEHQTNPSGGGTGAGSPSNETYTCTVRDAAGVATSEPPNGATGNTSTTDDNYRVYGENESVINDPDNPDSDSESTPDYGPCRVSNTDGSCTITVTQLEGEKGTAEICFWVEDPNDTTLASGRQDCVNNTEATYEAAAADGSDSGNDLADQVEKQWADARATAVDAEPETDTNRLGEQHTITATVYSNFGDTFTGAEPVYFEFFAGSPTDGDGNTPDTPDRTCTTPSNGSSCSITYTQSTTAGTDVVCVYLDSNATTAGVQGPTMTDTGGTRTCDGESLNDPDDDATGPDAPEPVDDNQDVVQKTWQPASAATRLNCEPETDVNPTETSHTFTCTATNNDGATPVDTEIDVEMTGANDPNGDTPTVPDFECRTPSTGTCSFTHSGNTSAPGTTTYRAWIDSDKNNTSTEADAAEGRNEATTPGRTGGTEPDETDVIEKTWQCPGTSPSPTPTATPTPTPTPSGSPSPRPTSCATPTPTPTPTPTATSTARPTATPTTTTAPPPPPECSDGIDNDDDGDTDHPNDTDCTGPSDNSESGFPEQEFGGTRGESVENGPCSGFTTGSVQPRSGGGLVIVGTNGPDALQGGDQDDLICGLGGADTIQGHDGADSIYGNAGKDGINGDNGNDRLFGNLGKDVMIGGDGRDRVAGGQQNDNLSGGADKDTLLGQGGWDTLKGNAADDTFVGAGGNDIIQGGGGNDVARGNGGDDVLKGFSGADTLRGGGGNDIVRGSAGKDTLRGGKGDDVLNGGGGNDSCRGGGGNDIIRRCE